MKRVQLLGRLAIYLCAAIVLSETIALLTLWQRGAINRRKLLGLLSIAYEIDVDSLRDPPSSKAAAANDAGSSVGQIELSRSLARLDWELRSGRMANTLEDLQHAQRDIAERQRKLTELREWYTAELAKLREAETDTELAEVQRTLISVRPAQAKDQLQRMWSVATDDRPESIDDVLTIITATGLSHRKRIFSEYRSAADQLQLAAILRHLRRGDPRGAVVKQARIRLREITGELPEESNHDIVVR